MTLNLGQLAREIVRESASPDPDVMVADLVARIDPADYREAICYLARGLLRDAIGQQRRVLNGGPTRNGSRKVANAREAWKRLLDSPEFVPSVGWLFLRDATHDQVLEMAGSRMAKSRELAAAAKNYRAIAAAMKKDDVAVVADLPDDTLATLLAPAAKAVKVA